MQLVIAELELVFGRFLRKVLPVFVCRSAYMAVSRIYQSWLAWVSVDGASDGTWHLVSSPSLWQQT